jgi:hypothetical protein
MINVVKDALNLSVRIRLYGTDHMIWSRDI